MQRYSRRAGDPLLSWAKRIKEARKSHEAIVQYQLLDHPPPGEVQLCGTHSNAAGWWPAIWDVFGIPQKTNWEVFGSQLL